MLWRTNATQTPNAYRITACRISVGRRAVVCVAIAAGALQAAPPEAVEFNRDIRPIFSDRCYTCHGPDQAKRNNKLRLDMEAGAKADLGGRFGLVPGDPAKSEVIRRVTADASRRMPPAWAGAARLSDREISLLTRWIEQGDVWQKHWSFIPPIRRELPAVSDPHWPKNAIDNFVLARLDSAARIGRLSRSRMPRRSAAGELKFLNFVASHLLSATATCASAAITTS